MINLVFESLNHLVERMDYIVLLADYRLGDVGYCIGIVFVNEFALNRQKI
jgi:hypothetical protein